MTINNAITKQVFFEWLYEKWDTINTFLKSQLNMITSIWDDIDSSLSSNVLMVTRNIYV